MDNELQTATNYQLTKQTLYFVSMLEAHQKAMFEVFDVTEYEERHFHTIFNNELDILLKKNLSIKSIEETMAKNKFF